MISLQSKGMLWDCIAEGWTGFWRQGGQTDDKERLLDSYLILWVLLNHCTLPSLIRKFSVCLCSSLSLSRVPHSGVVRHLPKHVWKLRGMSLPCSYIQSSSSESARHVLASTRSLQNWNQIKNTQLPQEERTDSSPQTFHKWLVSWKNFLWGGRLGDHTAHLTCSLQGQPSA